MAQLVVRGLEDSVKAKLRRRAALHGHSMEEEVRALLRALADEPADATRPGLGTEIARLFARVGLETEIPELRGAVLRPPHL